MKIYVVLLNWNGYSDTIECITSLLVNSEIDCTVLVCDNGSSDSSLVEFNNWAKNALSPNEVVFISRAEVMEGRVVAPHVKVAFVNNAINFGFAGGNNVGVNLALNDASCAYIWLLNNDTVVSSKTLSHIVKRMEQDPSIGICGSTLVYFDDRNLVQAFGGAVYSRWTGRSRHIGAFSSVSDIPATPDAVEKQMTYVVGASMLVRREFIEQVGLMREDYFLYCEEIDWATRGQGYFRLGYAPESVVFHKEGASIGTSAGGGSPLSLFYLFRNRVRYAWRFHRVFVPSVLFFCAVDLAKLVMRRRWPQAIAALRGVLQFSPPLPSVKSL